MHQMRVQINDIGEAIKQKMQRHQIRTRSSVILHGNYFNGDQVPFLKSVGMDKMF